MLGDRVPPRSAKSKACALPRSAFGTPHQVRWPRNWLRRAKIRGCSCRPYWFSVRWKGMVLLQLKTFASHPSVNSFKQSDSYRFRVRCLRVHDSYCEFPVMASQLQLARRTLVRPFQASSSIKARGFNSLIYQVLWKVPVKDAVAVVRSSQPQRQRI